MKTIIRLTLALLLASLEGLFAQSIEFSPAIEPADGEIVESSTPTEFFSNPTSARAKDFLSKILTH